MMLATNLIRQDGGTQMRVSISDATVESYADDMEAGQEFPPVTVFHDGKTYWLADGFHRIAARNMVAAKRAGTPEHEEWTLVSVDVHAGTRHDAIRWAIGANRKNGLRRTNADKQIAVRAALAHPDMQGMSDRVIAEELGVSHVMVFRARQLLTVNNSTPKSSTHKAIDTATDRWAKTIGTDGKSYPARPKASPAAAPKPSTRSGEEREQRVDSVASRAVTEPKHNHVCPTCNGRGYIE